MSHLAWVELRVADLARQRDFYRRVLGLEVLQEDSEGVVLGPSGELRLRAGAARVSPGSAPGLFHLAWRLPAPSDLAAWLHHVAELGVPLAGASDHGVSLALYLSDPEGNGLEVYVDRPESEWPKLRGALRMVSDPLDLERLLAAPGKPWRGFPAGGDLGHLHLQDTELTEPTHFFQSLGLELRQAMPGANFLALDGYHHHVAVNCWRVRGTRQPDGTGLSGYGLQGRQGFSGHDPWGHRVEVVPGLLQVEAG